MYDNEKIRRGRPWLMLLLLFAWLLPQQAAAEEYLHDPDHYSVSLGGSNIVYFTAPVYDQKNVDQWIALAYLYVSVDGGPNTPVFSWKANNYSDSKSPSIPVDATEVNTNFYFLVDGFCDFTPGNTNSTFRMTKGKSVNVNVKRNIDGYSFTFEGEWVVPYNMLGKKLTFTWEVTRYGNSPWRVTKVEGLKTVTINMPAPSAKLTPFVSNPMIDPNSPGKLQLPWFLASDSITKAWYEYTDASGVFHKENLADMNSGIIVLDANVPHKGLRVVCNYKAPGDKGSYEIEGVSSSPQNVPLIHAPVGLVARPLNDRKPKVELTWSVPYPDDDDLAPTDFFEIQRSLTGKEEDFKTISSSTFYAQVDHKTQFTYVDSTLLEAVETSMLANGGTLDHLTYRVRRAITQNWGWGADNNCAATATCVIDNMHLLRIASYKARWEDEEAYTVRAEWEYADEHGAVWDDRAKMMLRVISKNRAGDMVDSLVYTIDETERAQCYKIINLTRSCVSYDIDMYVERGTSPINHLADVKDYYVPIRSFEDWQDFNKKVEAAGGQYDLNARLYADITVNTVLGWQEGSPYRGTFDGNGHTLTVNYDGSVNSAYDNEYIAPFRYVTNATIKNLHVAGTISTKGKHAAGLIANARSGSKIYIDNCRSSVTINSSYNGETGNGGFLGSQDEATVIIRNSKFDGSFEGDNSSKNGGFVGWVASGSSLTIDNCLFAPDHINTKANGCATWAVKDEGNVSYSLINSYATREYDALFIIRNASDWHTFAVMVNEARNQYDVNAILSADITTSECAGVDPNAYYRGTFDGNGHTLTFNKTGVTEQYMAPFRYVGNATFKNLHVAGTIQTTAPRAGGLIGCIRNDLKITIENCRSSVDIKSDVNGEGNSGGFIGHIYNNTKVTFRNCVFDGKFEGSNSLFNGGFVGLNPFEYNNITFENCLFKPASVTTDPRGSDTWVYGGNGKNYSTANCYATNEFCHVINDGNDWETFRTALNQRGSKSVNAILNADFSINHSASNFQGLFDGNGHTLTLNGTDGLFVSGSNYTIRNLHVTGNIGGGMHVAGLVGASTGARNDIDCCWVSVSIHANKSHAGGFIGHASTTPHYINNCLFDGSVSANNDGKEEGTSYVGAFIGWSGEVDHHVTNCLEDGNYYYVDHAGFCYTNGSVWGNSGSSSNNYTYKGASWNEVNYAGIRHDNIDKVVEKLGSAWRKEGTDAVPKMFTRELWKNVGALSASDLASNLGTGWYVDGDQVLPVMGNSIIGTSAEDIAQFYTTGWTLEGSTLNPTTTTVEYRDYETFNDPNLKGLFYHKNTGKIEPELLTQTRQSSVLLSWSTDNKPIDFFRVLRRVKSAAGDAWKEVVTGLTDMSYEDTTVSPLATYEYKVQAVNECEGRDSTETSIVVGECKHTGRVEGYVRFNDGTGAPGVWVSVEYKAKELTRVQTDESGYFEVEELSYQGGTSVEYTVGPASDGVNIPSVLVTFDATSNNETLREFTITNGRRFSGFVMYNGTSIPVKGVNFLVDGNRIHNAQGKYVETDNDGSFSFRVLDGQHTVQAVMDKHVFTNGGWYKNSSKQNFTADVDGIYFYDDTKVTLTGRVVGGDDQGEKPLMNNLSMNNLGDSLTMVLTLEGDNTSWLVYDNLNPNRTEREEVVNHPVKGQDHYTTVRTERKRMTVWPDVTTGEYMLKLPPVRWKVQQVYCAGYPTLFQEGQVSEVIDLTNALDTLKVSYDSIYYDVDEKRVENPTATYQAVYNRIYHSPVEVTYKQIGYDNFDYLGDKTYISTDLSGEAVQVPLVYSVCKPNWPANRKDSLVAVYTLGHPVFSIERKYNIQLQVAEHYLYNNDPAGRVDIVPLKGGIAYMQNGMRALSMDDLYTIKEPQKLDSLGQCVFTLKADQTSNMSNCLRTVTFTVERDGSFIQAEPLQAYVMNMFPVGAGQDIMNEGAPILYDILRDPPGAYSNNTLAKGTTISFSYMMNASLNAGLFINLKVGDKLETVTATVSAPQGYGVAMGPINGADNADSNLDMLMYSGSGSKAFSHTMVVGNNISTSGDPSMVGADADLYIGTVQNVTVTPMSSIRAVSKDQMLKLIARLGKDNIKTLTEKDVNSELAKNVDYGSVVVIATGEDANGNPVYLIRDLALGYGPKIESNFIYSQKQLLTQIIPQKSKEIVDLMFLGTKEEAQQIANRTKKPVYLSLREPTDPMFAVVNKKVDGKVDGHPYNITKDKADEGVNYLVVLPANASENDYTDEVEDKYEVIKAWVDMIARNESEKLHASDKLNNYDVAGAAGVNYSETFDAGYSSSWSNHFPIATEVDYFGLGAGASNVFSAVGIAGSFASAIGLSLKEMNAWSTPKPDLPITNIDNGMQSTVTFTGKYLHWALFPIASYTTVGADSEARSYNRTESFTIACDLSSHLNVDVYRVHFDGSDQNKDVNVYDVFTNDNFNNFYEMVADQVRGSLKSMKINGPRGFVFRTRGGATQNPWEDQRVTKFYDPGTQLDARTLKIVNPKIRLDKQSVSGVAIDDAAKFTVYVGNDSEKPEATDGITILQVFVPDQLNPQGAKISINGQTLTTGGMTVSCIPGQEVALQMEVRAGRGFDYEGLVIGVMSPTDAEHTYALTTFDVHFLREAGGVNIAVPGDKWVLNTNAQQDSKRGWYLPVTINGFDRYQHNFDHIEFQYKESQRGDDAWTNLCSFYADDSLMAKANGERELMKENANITTQFYGEGWTMERAYDLRAVLFCRNGSDFLTTSSKIISGVKDTRRPQLFGTPEPKSGLLTSGDDIVFNFSEDIEYNYLSAITNFEVKGEVNNNSLSEMVSVQFNGKASVESEAKRNFTGKDLTIDMMVKPAETGRDMPLFSHGNNGQKLQLWLTKDFKLKAVVNDQTFTTDSVLGKNAFRHVAMVLNQTDSLLTLYYGGLEVGHQKLSSLYSGTSNLVFGRTNEQNRNESQYYEGRMMEARLWYAAMSGTLIGSTYGGQRLTGYEKDLVDYYPMNEGSGDYVIDHTQGANAKLVEASWAIPQGLSLHLEKADNGVLLDKNAMNRTADQDYTLMFWFKTDRDGRGALLSNGRGQKEDINSENQFHIGFEAEKLMYRSNGYAVEVPGDWSDGQWHNFAMTVNRGRNVANIYVDKELRTTFEADSLGGISGGYPLIGATRYDHLKDNGDVEVINGLDALKGNVDELLFFAQALPKQLISTYTTKSPNGDEAGLMTYLSFDRQERQKDNSIELVPYVYSKKLYLDDHGNPRYQLDPLTKEPTDTLVRDYLFVDDMDVVMQHFDKTQAAPVMPYEEVTNLKFSFIGSGNKVLVELDESAAKMNHRNIYVTLRDIEDKNGNTMASPQTACYYVTNSSLQWLVNRLDYTVKYGSGESSVLAFYNNGAQSHSYTIDNCPRWLTLSKYSDAVAPQTLDDVVATVSKDLNIGTYSEVIYLTDEEGISEPFYINLTVEGEQPDWATNIRGDLLQNSMTISGQVYLYNELDTDVRDIVGVFDDQNQCHGYANISHNAQTGENGLYLTVYDNQASGRELKFRLWQYSTGRELVIKPQTTITFDKNVMLGTDQPVRFDGGESFIQNFVLNQGWNWVSFNVQSERLFNLSKLLSGVAWSDGDILTDMSSDLTLTYEKAQKDWLASGSTSKVIVSPKKAYAIMVHKDCVFPIEGSVIRNEDARTISLKEGWNAIGYTPMANLTVETALSDYYDQAEPGDVIKSHTEFAYFTKAGNTGRWRGNLQYMKPGEGYMLLRKGAANASFTYPYYDMNSNFNEIWSIGSNRAAAQMKSRTTMSVSATVTGFEMEEGDVLVAYANGETVGEACLLSAAAAEAGEPLYLSIAGDDKQPIWFAIERDGEIVASTGEVMTFKANDVIGSPDEPTAISFAKVDYENGKWYTIGGRWLQKKPTRSGIYIFNGHKVVVK